MYRSRIANRFLYIEFAAVFLGRRAILVLLESARCVFRLLSLLYGLVIAQPFTVCGTLALPNRFKVNAIFEVRKVLNVGFVEHHEVHVPAFLTSA
jgi:hypothetical protein